MINVRWCRLAAQCIVTDFSGEKVASIMEGHHMTLGKVTSIACRHCETSPEGKTLIKPFLVNLEPCFILQ